MRISHNRPVSSNKVWIGLALVDQLTRDGVLGDADRAYVNVLALAGDESDFRAQIQDALNELGLTLIRVEDVEPMDARLSKHHVHRDLRRLAEEVKSTGSPKFDIFQSFDLD